MTARRSLTRWSRDRWLASALRFDSIADGYDSEFATKEQLGACYRAREMADFCRRVAAGRVR